MMEKLAQPGEEGGRGCTPTSFHYIYKVVVYAPAERADTFHLFLLYPYMYSVALTLSPPLKIPSLWWHKLTISVTFNEVRLTPWPLHPQCLRGLNMERSPVISCSLCIWVHGLLVAFENTCHDLTRHCSASRSRWREVAAFTVAGSVPPFAAAASVTA
jgi:hypothetical protein